MTRKEKEKIHTEIDEMTAKFHELIDSGNAVVKAVLTVWLEALEAKANAQQNATQKIAEKALMKIEDVAAYLNVTKRAIRGWIKKDAFPVRYVGADLRFDLTEVDEWTKRERKNPSGAMCANGKVQPLQTRLQASKEQKNVSL